MRSRTDGLVAPGVLTFTDARVYLRIAEKGHNLGLLIEDKDGTRHNYVVICHPIRLGRVALLEVDP